MSGAGGGGGGGGLGKKKFWLTPKCELSNDRALSLAWNHDGSKLACGNMQSTTAIRTDGTKCTDAESAVIWNVTITEGDVLTTKIEPYCAAWQWGIAWGGDVLAVEGSDKGTVKLLNLTTGEFRDLGPWASHSREISTLAWRNNVLISGSYSDDDPVSDEDPVSGQLKTWHLNADLGNISVANFMPLGGDFSARHVAFSVSTTPIYNLLDTKTKVNLKREYEGLDPSIHDNRVATALKNVVGGRATEEMVVDAKRFLLGGSFLATSDFFKVTVWDVEKFITIHDTTLSTTHGSPVAGILSDVINLGTWNLGGDIHGLAWHPKKDILAVCGKNGDPITSIGGEIKLIDVGLLQRRKLDSSRRSGLRRSLFKEESEETWFLRDPEEVIASIAWSFDGNWLASTTTNGIVKVWDWTTRTAICYIKTYNTMYSDCYSVAWHPKQNVLATASPKSIQIWTVELDLKKSRDELVRYLTAINQDAPIRVVPRDVLGMIADRVHDLPPDSTKQFSLFCM